MPCLVQLNQFTRLVGLLGSQIGGFRRILGQVIERVFPLQTMNLELALPDCPFVLGLTVVPVERGVMGGGFAGE